MYRSFFIFILLSALSFSCATTESYSSPKVALKGDDIQNAQESAFGLNFNVKELDSLVSDLLKKYPDNSDLNEIAGLLALLKLEKSKAFLHLIKAVTDLGSKNISLFLEIIDSMS